MEPFQTKNYTQANPQPTKNFLKDVSHKTDTTSSSNNVVVVSSSKCVNQNTCSDEDLKTRQRNGKKDIFQKIRSHIIERKRKRYLANLESSDVWRPW